MRRIGILTVALVAVFAAERPSLADDDPLVNFWSSFDTPFSVWVPSFDARLAMGFNYDLLRPLTDVSFRYPVGYLGFNLPIGYSAGLGDFLDDETMNDIFSNGKIFKKGERFKPTAGTEQNTNYSVRVDVPMLYGVGTFAYTQNFFMNFNTALGGSSIIKETRPITYKSDPLNIAPDTIGFVSLKGALRLPLAFSLGWETMTFGYAYRVGNSDDLIFALNMNRHLFSADIRLKADIDLLGHVNFNVKGIDMGNGGGAPIDTEFINFSSDKFNGFAQGRFRAEGWSPSIGIKWKRFALNSRFGLSVKATGSGGGGFIMPQILDSIIETGELILDSAGVKGVDQIEYDIPSLKWKMPQGHTLSFDIIPQRLNISYTKIFGEIAMEMDILRKKDSLGSTDNSHADFKSTKVDVGILVDHILVLSASYPWFFASAGFAGFDIRSNDKHVLRDNSSLSSLRVGDVVMLLPILNGGFNIGTKLQLRLEADILPLPAVRSGVNYYF
ncbi:hypothetical protein R80B4_01322 [Fibrobacteres bacterium R8-0-B4]